MNTYNPHWRSDIFEALKALGYEPLDGTRLKHPSYEKIVVRKTRARERSVSEPTDVFVLMVQRDALVLLGRQDRPLDVRIDGRGPRWLAKLYSAHAAAVFVHQQYADALDALAASKRAAKLAQDDALRPWLQEIEPADFRKLFRVSFSANHEVVGIMLERFWLHSAITGGEYVDIRGRLPHEMPRFVRLYRFLVIENWRSL